MIKSNRFLLSLALLVLTKINLLAQGTNGIAKGAQTLTAFTASMKLYMDPITTLMYVIAGITGVIGAYKVYTEWQGGEGRNIMAKAWGWVGSCLFLLVANAMLRSFFVD